MFKKIAVLLAAATLSAPAFADRGHRGHDHHYSKKHRPVVHHYQYYRPAPPPRVVHHYHSPAPQPVVVVHRHEPVLPLLVGAVIGAAIVHHAVTGY
jgi:hypothetical protein